MYAAPVVFVDYQRADYGGPSDELLQYYFVFLREKQSRDGMGTDVISRVLRLCRVSSMVHAIVTASPQTQCIVLCVKYTP